MSIDGWKPGSTDANSDGPAANVLAVPYLPLEGCSLDLVAESTDEPPSAKSNADSDAFFLARLKSFCRLVEAPILSLRSEVFGLLFVRALLLAIPCSAMRTAAPSFRLMTGLLPGKSESLRY
eukprot:1552524-Pyramimonas_sp.AAC.1